MATGRISNDFLGDLVLPLEGDEVDEGTYDYDQMGLVTVGAKVRQASRKVEVALKVDILKTRQRDKGLPFAVQVSRTLARNDDVAWEASALGRTLQTFDLAITDRQVTISRRERLLKPWGDREGWLCDFFKGIKEVGYQVTSLVYANTLLPAIAEGRQQAAVLGLSEYGMKISEQGALRLAGVKELAPLYTTPEALPAGESLAAPNLEDTPLGHVLTRSTKLITLRSVMDYHAQVKKLKKEPAPFFCGSANLAAAITEFLGKEGSTLLAYRTSPPVSWELYARTLSETEVDTAKSKQDYVRKTVQWRVLLLDNSPAWTNAMMTSLRAINGTDTMVLQPDGKLAHKTDTTGYAFLSARDDITTNHLQKLAKGLRGGLHTSIYGFAVSQGSGRLFSIPDDNLELYRDDYDERLVDPEMKMTHLFKGDLATYYELKANGMLRLDRDLAIPMLILPDDMD